jgi:hypothetical protein
MPAMRYGISFAHPACFTGDNSFAKAPVMAGSKQCGVPIPLSSPSRMSVAKVTNEDVTPSSPTGLRGLAGRK